MLVIFWTIFLYVGVGLNKAQNSNGVQAEEDRWTWDYVDQPTPTTTGQNPVDRTNTDPDAVYCEPYNPPPLNLTGRGLRKSEIVCYGYIYDMRVRRESADRDKKCEDYKRRQGIDGDTFHFEAVGGRDAEPGEFPHMGAIGWTTNQNTYIFKCGCSLINSKFVLTAAHCTRASDRDTTIADPVPKIVNLGDRDILEKGLQISISKIISHPKYASPKKYFDIALMELESEVFSSKMIHPACLWSKFDLKALGKEATLTGWGVIETVHHATAPILQAAVVDIIDSHECDVLLRPRCNRHWCGIQEHQLCAGKLAGGVDACQGDSGGPLQVKIDLPFPPGEEASLHYVIGVTSFGIGCAQPNLPGVYTRVSSFIEWIESIVWK